jgi:hypothetical protein
LVSLIGAHADIAERVPVNLAAVFRQRAKARFKAPLFAMPHAMRKKMRSLVSADSHVDHGAGNFSMEAMSDLPCSASIH